MQKIQKDLTFGFGPWFGDISGRKGAEIGIFGGVRKGSKLDFGGTQYT